MKKTAMDLSKKKIVVTGGAGFLGSYVVEQLITFGAKKRNIFISLTNFTQYAMFDVKRPENYAKEVRDFSEILEKIEKLEQELEDLKKLIKWKIILYIIKRGNKWFYRKMKYKIS